ncbi:hypothetical protein HYPSUDRAFT_67156 [Hypholoma sublateritium FD-334 SS-4]|uniref:Uncharacterized protein n=1 Tax=Hypholoma sublateritium (strain FD-334 SS-4) TaxID=945553 RepID=A0A0D2PQX8_HYPSF|nr:hypothetical protein HYPSUDRAFT_67156 [Hypholoma sublateritium FD-334 SS-4]
MNGLCAVSLFVPLFAEALPAIRPKFDQQVDWTWAHLVKGWNMQRCTYVYHGGWDKGSSELTVVRRRLSSANTHVIQ